MVRSVALSILRIAIVIAVLASSSCDFQPRAFYKLKSFTCQDPSESRYTYYEEDRPSANSLFDYHTNYIGAMDGADTPNIQSDALQISVLGADTLHGCTEITLGVVNRGQDPIVINPKNFAFTTATAAQPNTLVPMPMRSFVLYRPDDSFVRRDYGNAPDDEQISIPPKESAVIDLRYFGGPFEKLILRSSIGKGDGKADFTVELSFEATK